MKRIVREDVYSFDNWDKIRSLLDNDIQDYISKGKSQLAGEELANLCQVVIQASNKFDPKASREMARGFSNAVRNMRFGN